MLLNKEVIISWGRQGAESNESLSNALKHRNSYVALLKLMLIFDFVLMFEVIW